MNDIQAIGTKYELSLGDNRVIIDSFGAKVLAFFQGSDNRLFYDFEDISHSGIPLCFPSFGPLENNELSVASGKYAMKQHGFARDMDFALINKTDSSIVLKISSNETTLLRYPFKFVFAVKYTLIANELQITLAWHNMSKHKAPLSPGVHPYFKVYDKEAIVLKTNSLSYNLSTDFSEVEDVVGSEFLDAATKSSFIIKGAPDINLIHHNLEHTNVLLGGGKSIKMVYDTVDFDRLTIWRKNAQEDYICVEPANAQNKINNNPLLIELGDVWESTVKIEFN